MGVFWALTSRNFSVDDLKKRWKNIKDQYRKELKKLPQSRPGVPLDNITSNWRYFEYLAFMRDEMVVFKDMESENLEMDHEVMADGSLSKFLKSWNIIFSTYLFIYYHLGTSIFTGLN